MRLFSPWRRYAPKCISMESFDEIVGKIASHTGMDRKEIVSRIRSKQNELANMISEEGAAYIIAKECGIELLKKKDHEVKIGSLISGLKNVNISGRVMKIDGVREFKTEKAQGKVSSVLIGDDTGIIRTILWNDQADLAKDLKKGGLVKVTNAYVKDNMGRTEASVGKSGKIEKIPDSPEIPFVEELEKKFSGQQSAGKSYERKHVSGLKEGDYAELRACIVRVFEGNPFYFTCPDCGMKVSEPCPTHGKREPTLVVSAIMDDGTGNMRIVLFRNSVEKLIGISTPEAYRAFEKKLNAQEVYGRIELGKDFIFRGFVKKNKLVERLEFVAGEVEEIDARKEAERLIC